MTICLPKCRVGSSRGSYTDRPRHQTAVRPSRPSSQSENGSRIPGSQERPQHVAPGPPFQLLPRGDHSLRRDDRVARFYGYTGVWESKLGTRPRQFRKTAELLVTRRLALVEVDPSLGWRWNSSDTASRSGQCRHVTGDSGPTFDGTCTFGTILGSVRPIHMTGTDSAPPEYRSRCSAARLAVTESDLWSQCEVLYARFDAQGRKAASLLSEITSRISMRGCACDHRSTLSTWDVLPRLPMGTDTGPFRVGTGR